MAGEISYWCCRSFGYSFETHESALRQMLAREHDVKVSTKRMKRLLWLAEFLAEKLKADCWTADEIYSWYFRCPSTSREYEYKSQTTFEHDLSLVCKMGFVEVTKPYPKRLRRYWNRRKLF